MHEKAHVSSISKLPVFHEFFVGIFICKRTVDKVYALLKSGTQISTRRKLMQGTTENGLLTTH